MRKTVNVIAVITLVFSSSCEKEKQLAPETQPLIMEADCSGCGEDWDLTDSIP